jgi:hypothetical protein
MNKLENSLNKIAENILHIDKASLTSLWDKYKNHGYETPKQYLETNSAASCGVLYPPLCGIVQLTNSVSLRFRNWSFTNKVEQFSNSSEWEKAVIIFSIINAVRAENAIFNEKLLNNKAPQKTATPEKPQDKPYLKLVK